MKTKFAGFKKSNAFPFFPLLVSLEMAVLESSRTLSRGGGSCPVVSPTGFGGWSFESLPETSACIRLFLELNDGLWHQKVVYAFMCTGPGASGSLISGTRSCGYESPPCRNIAC